MKPLDIYIKISILTIVSFYTLKENYIEIYLRFECENQNKIFCNLGVVEFTWTGQKVLTIKEK